VNLLSSLWINHQPATPSMYAAPVLTVITNNRLHSGRLQPTFLIFRHRGRLRGRL
jgi:hypothetical protein